MLIVIEGLDGAGKSTQVNAVKNYIISKGIELEYMHFPRYDGLYGSLIARFLRGEFGSIEQVHPQLVALYYLWHLDRKYLQSSWKARQKKTSFL